MNNRGFDDDMMETVNSVEKRCDGEFDKFCKVLADYRKKTNELHALRNSSETVVETFNDKCDSVGILYEHVWETGGRQIIDIKRKIKEMFVSGGDKVVLSTTHSAKGAEAPRVFLVQPGKRTKKSQHPDDLAQERNLDYIARTRCTQAGDGHLTFLVDKKGELCEF
jgi:DNA helicase-2/ATP-dependent DNA helicase PcrA